MIFTFEEDKKQNKRNNERQDKIDVWNQANTERELKRKEAKDVAENAIAQANMALKREMMNGGGGGSGSGGGKDSGKEWNIYSNGKKGEAGLELRIHDRAFKDAAPAIFNALAVEAREGMSDKEKRQFDNAYKTPEQQMYYVKKYWGDTDTGVELMMRLADVKNPDVFMGTAQGRQQTQQEMQNVTQGQGAAMARKFVPGSGQFSNQ